MIDSNVLNDKVVDTSAPIKHSGVGLRVRAIRKGFAGVVREPGDVFTLPAGSKGSWFVSVEKPAAEKAKGTVLSDADLA